MKNILLILAGAAIGAAITFYFFGNNGELSMAPGCAHEGRISVLNAQNEIDRYLNAANPNFLLDSEGNRLKGWRIDRCKIESIFHKYNAEADAIQLYIGLNNDGSNSLVWVGSDQDPSTSEIKDLIDPHEAEPVVDLTSICPKRCPNESPLNR